jgi:hypothetical protein
MWQIKAIFAINVPGMHMEETMIIEAVRISVRLGCHRVVKTGGTEVLHYKAFWVVYILERMMCFFYGRGPVRRQAATRGSFTDKTKSLSDYDIGCPIPDVPESKIYGVDFFVMLLRGARILSKAYQMLFSVSATLKSAEQYFVAIDSVKGDMDRWRNTIPVKYRPGMPFNVGNTWSTFMFLRIHYVYHSLIISLCRLELHIASEQQSPRIARTTKLLMDAARTCIQLTTYIDLKPYTPLW